MSATGNGVCMLLAQTVLSSIRWPFQHKSISRGVMKKYLGLLASVGLAAIPQLTKADGPSATPSITTPLITLSNVLVNSGITANGYVDASYDYLNSDAVFTSGVPSRVFDTSKSAFALHQVGLIAGYLPTEGFGALLNLTLAQDAGLIHSNGGGTDSNFDITQAFVQYATGALTVIGGKYVTASGAEVINSTANSNASRSILFGYAIPFTHTGVRAAYKVSDALSVFGGVNNGWDQVTDLNQQKTAEVGASFTPSKVVNVAAVVYSGNEPGAGGTTNGNRTLVDVVATLNVTDALSFVLNGDYARQSNAIAQGVKATWYGGAGYANYKFSDQWRSSLRFEYFDDKEGYRTGVPQKWKEATATVVYSPAASLDLLAEVRDDWTTNHAILRHGSPASSQFSATIKAIFKFGTPAPSS